MQAIRLQIKDQLAESVGQQLKEVYEFVMNH